MLGPSNFFWLSKSSKVFLILNFFNDKLFDWAAKGFLGTLLVFVQLDPQKSDSFSPAVLIWARMLATISAKYTEIPGRRPPVQNRNDFNLMADHVFMTLWLEWANSRIGCSQFKSTWLSHLVDSVCGYSYFTKMSRF